MEAAGVDIKLNKRLCEVDTIRPALDNTTTGLSAAGSASAQATSGDVQLPEPQDVSCFTSKEIPKQIEKMTAEISRCPTGLARLTQLHEELCEVN